MATLSQGQTQPSTPAVVDIGSSSSTVDVAPSPPPTADLAFVSIPATELENGPSHDLGGDIAPTSAQNSGKAGTGGRKQGTRTSSYLNSKVLLA